MEGPELKFTSGTRLQFEEDQRKKSRVSGLEVAPVSAERKLTQVYCWSERRRVAEIVIRVQDQRKVACLSQE
ncbi:hypothetical protein KOW79_019811 [Hemibagrus wyckioides]|uniref:Uncharacterized protein n=1 Tax=Hemibagrus wyckioides TaxID=337641 RepID=A0A9D3N5Z4_9TELE|nr:hypothetical protein KOW79_019811 [Hemibagrus wyckioides]